MGRIKIGEETSYEKSSINQQKTFFLSVVKGGSLIKLPKCAFSKSIAVGIQTSYSRLYFTSVEMAVGSSFKDMSEMSHMHIGNGNGCRGLLEESPDRLLMNTEFEEALELQEDLIQKIRSQPYFQTGTLLNGLPAESAKLFEFDVTQILQG